MGNLFTYKCLIRRDLANTCTHTHTHPPPPHTHISPTHRYSDIFYIFPLLPIYYTLVTTKVADPNAMDPKPSFYLGGSRSQICILDLDHQLFQSKYIFFLIMHFSNTCLRQKTRLCEKIFFFPYYITVYQKLYRFMQVNRYTVSNEILNLKREALKIPEHINYLTHLHCKKFFGRFDLKVIQYIYSYSHSYLVQPQLLGIVTAATTVLGIP